MPTTSRALSSRVHRFALLVVSALLLWQGAAAFGLFESDDEGKIWETLPYIGESASRCLPGSLRDFLAPPQCPPGQPLQGDELYEPLGVGVYDPGVGAPNRAADYRVYVADHGNSRVVAFDINGGFVRTIGLQPGDPGFVPQRSATGEILLVTTYPEGTEVPPGQVLLPDGVTPDSSGNVLVADLWAGRVSVFASDGTFLYVVKMPPGGEAPTQRAQPSQIAVLEGTTVAAAPASAATCASTPAGAGRIAVSTWGPQVTYDGTGPVTGMNQVLIFDERWCQIAALGTASIAGDFAPGNFVSPTQVSFDPTIATPRLAVASPNHGTVQIFEEAGGSWPLVLTASWEDNAPPLYGIPPAPWWTSPLESVQYPYGAIFDDRGRLVVGDLLEQRLAVLQPDYVNGQVPMLFELRGGGALAGYPHAVAQDDGGTYFVAVASLDRIQAFTIPDLAVFDEHWTPDTPGQTSVAPGDQFEVTFSITVPEAKPAVALVEPTISFTGPAIPVNPSDPEPAPGDAEPPINLATGDTLTYTYTFEATTDPASQIVFNVGAQGNPVGGVPQTVAPEKTVTVPVVCATCEQVPPTISATPLGVPVGGVYGSGTVRLEATDALTGGSGIRRIFWRFTGGPEAVSQPGLLQTDDGVAVPSAPEPRTVDIVFTTSGTSTIEFWAIDGDGNVSDLMQASFTFDLHPPSVTFSVPPPSGVKSGIPWWKTDVVLGINASDNFTPASQIVLTQGGLPVTQLTFTQEGALQSQTVQATDLVGNTRVAPTSPISIDKTAPGSSIASNPGGAYNGPVTVTLSAIDQAGLSGVRRLWYQLSGAQTQALAQLPDGQATGTVAISAPGVTVLTFYAEDWAGNVEPLANTATYTLNGLPVAAPDALTTAEDTPSAPLDVLANDTDPEGGGLTLVSVASGASGTTQIVGGLVVYTPAPDFHGAGAFTYVVSDGTGQATGTVTVTVTPVPDAPTANDDVATTFEETPVLIPVLANDTDGDGDILSLDPAGLVQPAGGTATIVGDAIEYVPDFDAFHLGGIDTFQYTAIDPTGLTGVATVTVTVIDINDPPIGQPDTAIVPEDTPTTIFVLANDTDADGDELFIYHIDPPNAGTAVISADRKTVIYTPQPEYSGPDAFGYYIEDGTYQSPATIAVSLTVVGVNDPPVAADDSASTVEDAAVLVPVLANDTDIDGDPLRVAAIVTPPLHGAVSVPPDGSSVTYTPDPDFHGTDSFVYLADDGQGGTDAATVTITVTPEPDPPVAVDDAATVDEDTPATIDVLANDSDPDGDPLTVVAAGATAVPGSSVVINPDFTVTYTPAPDYAGPDTFTYTMSDGTTQAQATVTVTVAPVNDPPIATDDALTTAEDTPGTVDVLANDTDVDGGALTIQSWTDPAHGTVSVDAGAGLITYTPDPNFHGIDAFTYVAGDGNGGTATASVGVTVTPVNDAPVANPDAATIVQGTQAVIAATANDTDVDGDVLSITAVTGALNGSVTFTADTVIWVPASAFTGVETLTYAVSDGQGGTATSTIVITVTPDNAPQAGCSSGFWRNSLASWAATPYSPDQPVWTVFAGFAAYPSLANKTLMQTLTSGGGSGATGAAKILGRQAVAALLNAAHPQVNFPRTVDEVVYAVNAALFSGNRWVMTALASQLDAENNIGCPLNNHGEVPGDDDGDDDDDDDRRGNGNGRGDRDDDDDDDDGDNRWGRKGKANVSFIEFGDRDDRDRRGPTIRFVGFGNSDDDPDEDRGKGRGARNDDRGNGNGRGRGR